MSVVLGIDVGGSTTKIVGLHDEKLVGTMQVRAEDQLTSLFGAIGNFLLKNKIQLSEVTSISLTGVGATFIDEPIYGIETKKVNEFQAVGLGALKLSGLREAFVISLGTGTAIVRAGKDGIRHVGGSGVGGGTIIGLSKLMIGKSDFESIVALAASGNLGNIDLTVRDIVGQEIPSLPSDITASNFGNVKSTAAQGDIALAIINMVFQTAGMLAVLASRGDSITDVVLTGTLTSIPQAPELFALFRNLYNLSYSIPQNAVFATAIGAAYSR